MSLTTNCVVCNKEFNYYPSKPRKYCSTECRVLHKKQEAGMSEVRTCSFCSAKFLPKYSCQKTCSSDCRKKASGKNREKVYQFNCENCGKECESHRKNRTTYCSLECYHQLIGERSEAWKTKRVCENCNASYVPTYKPQRYCSRNCSTIVVGKEKTENTTKIVICGWCKKDFRKDLGDLGKDNDFCSIQCFHFFLRNGQEKYLIKTCPTCNEIFETLYRKEATHCSRECSSLYQPGENHIGYGKEGPCKGLKPWTYGLTKETDERIANLAEKISQTHKEQFVTGIRSNKGENNPNWKLPEDRLTPLHQAIRQSSKYNEWRLSVFKRDNFTCVLCGDKNNFINADHIKRFCFIVRENAVDSLEKSFLCKELWNINNGRTLCVDCHRKTETYGNVKKDQNA